MSFGLPRLDSEEWVKVLALQPSQVRVRVLVRLRIRLRHDLMPHELPFLNLRGPDGHRAERPAVLALRKRPGQSAARRQAALRSFEHQPPFWSGLPLGLPSPATLGMPCGLL